MKEIIRRAVNSIGVDCSEVIEQSNPCTTKFFIQINDFKSFEKIKKNLKQILFEISVDENEFCNLTLKNNQICLEINNKEQKTVLLSELFEQIANQNDV